MSRKEVAKKVAQLTIFNPNPKSSKDLWQKNSAKLASGEVFQVCEKFPDTKGIDLHTKW